MCFNVSVWLTLLFKSFFFFSFFEKNLKVLFLEQIRSNDNLLYYWSLCCLRFFFPKTKNRKCCFKNTIELLIIFLYNCFPFIAMLVF